MTHEGNMRVSPGIRRTGQEQGTYMLSNSWMALRNLSCMSQTLFYVSTSRRRRRWWDGHRGPMQLSIHVFASFIVLLLPIRIAFGLQSCSTSRGRGAEASWGGGDRGEIAPSRRPTYKTTGFSKTEQQQVNIRSCAGCAKANSIHSHAPSTVHPLRDQFTFIGGRIKG